MKWLERWSRQAGTKNFAILKGCDNETWS
jgi:hypothetical protein